MFGRVREEATESIFASLFIMRMFTDRRKLVVLHITLCKEYDRWREKRRDKF